MKWKRKKYTLVGFFKSILSKVTRQKVKSGVTEKKSRNTKSTTTEKIGVANAKGGKISSKEKNAVIFLNVCHSSDYQDTLRKQYKMMKKLSKKENKLK